MSAYTSVFDWCIYIGQNKYRTVKELRWELGRKGSGFWYVVPAGVTFDVSVPWWACPIFSPHDKRYLKAAALHDQMLLVDRWSRVTSGAEFHQALHAQKVGPTRRLIMWLAVSAYKWK